MLISTLIPNFNLAISLVPVLMIPFIIMSGFFVNTNNLPVVFKPIEYLSFVKYTYQGLYTVKYRIYLRMSLRTDRVLMSAVSNVIL